MRGVDDKDVAETGIKAEKEESSVQEREQEEHAGNELDEIEGKISDIEQRLREINAQKQGVDEDSEDYASLENQRRILRKELIDLDYRHKQVFHRYKKQNQQDERHRWEETERKILEQKE